MDFGDAATKLVKSADLAWVATWLVVACVVFTGRHGLEFLKSLAAMVADWKAKKNAPEVPPPATIHTADYDGADRREPCDCRFTPEYQALMHLMQEFQKQLTKAQQTTTEHIQKLVDATHELTRAIESMGAGVKRLEQAAGNGAPTIRGTS